jgi:hypothetical protein
MESLQTAFPFAVNNSIRISVKINVVDRVKYLLLGGNEAPACRKRFHDVSIS